MGQGPGLSNYNLGEDTGTETVTLSVTQMPSHSHSVQASAVDATLKSPSGAVLGHTKPHVYDSAPDGTTTMNAGMILPAGDSQPVPNLQPLLVLNFCIAMQGIFPSRN
jgi:microcystin-dependent protein